MRKPPVFHEGYYHREGDKFFHQFDHCPEGSLISEGEKLPGTGSGIKLCEYCIKMRREETDDDEGAT
jgi:hypothetical protein